MNIHIDLIKKIVQIIVDTAHPVKIILFGSYARGEENENSDLDFLVIKETSEPRHLRTKEIRRQLRGLKFPIDIIVYTPEELSEWDKIPQSFANTIMAEGKVLYG
ncbi:MAG: nucleotidyltransferase domain-containing protein [Chitinispirillaceae bacterium]|nr:nucleotidyltransferase domain-containing protein [Chitinispirillaceae bacterium]